LKDGKAFAQCTDKPLFKNKTIQRGQGIASDERGQCGLRLYAIEFNLPDSNRIK